MTENQRQKGPGDVPTGERMKHIGTAMMSGIVHQMSGQQREKGAAYVLDQATVEGLIERWPSGPKMAARNMLERYGPPNEGTPVRLIWHRNGRWKRTEVTSDELPHNFPAAHTDFITNWIDYQVPLERFSDLARYDGSCLLDRTAGEAGARCDSEAANLITLNLMHEIVTRQRTVEQAREKYAEQMAAYSVGRSAPYAERLLFDPPSDDTRDRDEARMADKMVTQAVGKAKDVTRRKG
jgi:hypothetical protein